MTSSTVAAVMWTIRRARKELYGNEYVCERNIDMSKQQNGTLDILNKDRLLQGVIVKGQSFVPSTSSLFFRGWNFVVEISVEERAPTVEVSWM